MACWRPIHSSGRFNEGGTKEIKFPNKLIRIMSIIADNLFVKGMRWHESIAERNARAAFFNIVAALLAFVLIRVSFQPTQSPADKTLAGQPQAQEAATL